MKRLRDAAHDPDLGLKAGTITQAERDTITQMQDLVARVVAVDDFTPEALRRHFPSLNTTSTQKESAG